MPVQALELPRCDNTEFLIVNRDGRYSLLYDTMYRQAAWVAYILTRDEVGNQGVKRKDNFKVDNVIRLKGWPVATNEDYKRSGYDRGHLVPSADRNDTQAENTATFLLSNMSPQTPALNRTVWRELEEQVRVWATQKDSLFIVTGGELTDDIGRIGSGVGVPDRFFKALLAKDDKGNYHAIAFLIPNFSKIKGSFTDYCLTVNELEERLNYDLFYNLSDNIEEAVEDTVDTTFWK